MTALRFGLNPLPPGVEAAWGARLIVTQDGYVDFVPDRTDAVGPDEPRRALLDHLNLRAGDKPWQKLKQLLSSGELSTREDKRVTLFEDDTILVDANPNSSAGYCFVVAYFKADLAPAATPGSAPRCACTEKGMDPVPTDPKVDGRCRRCGDFIEYVSTAAEAAQEMTDRERRILIAIAEVRQAATDNVDRQKVGSPARRGAAAYLQAVTQMHALITAHVRDGNDPDLFQRQILDHLKSYS